MDKFTRPVSTFAWRRGRRQKLIVFTDEKRRKACKWDDENWMFSGLPGEMWPVSFDYMLVQALKFCFRGWNQRALVFLAPEKGMTIQEFDMLICFASLRSTSEAKITCRFTAKTMVAYARLHCRNVKDIELVSSTRTQIHSKLIEQCK